MWKPIFAWILLCWWIGGFAEPVSELDLSRWRKSGDIYHLQEAGFKYDIADFEINFREQGKLEWEKRDILKCVCA